MRHNLPCCLVCSKPLSRKDATHCKRHRQITEETRKKYRNRIWSLETRTKLSRAAKGNTHGFQKGVPSWNKDIGVPWLTGQNHPAWKGKKVSYRALHKWIERKLGKPKFCTFCKASHLSHRQYNWANISGKYIRNTNDWMRLCVSCHRKYDRSNKLPTKDC